VAIRDTLAKNAQPHLMPGEQIQAVFSAATHGPLLVGAAFAPLAGLLGARVVGDTSPALAFLLTLAAFAVVVVCTLINSFRVVVATDHRIVVFRSGRWRTSPVYEQLYSIHRSVVIGPARGLWFRAERLGPDLSVHRKFHRDIASADAVAPHPGAMAPT
jgi:hypothetical protein